MKNSIQLGSKTMDIPIIQGGMGVGVSLSKLAGAVMLEGGMGVISAANPGYAKPNFWQNSIACNCEALKEEIQKAKAISQGKGICGVNAMVAGNNYETYVKAAIESGVDAIISGAGLPMNLPSIEGSEHVLLAPIVSSAKAARLILKSWDRHYHRCADFLVIESSEAGGHLGFKKEDLMNGNVQSLEEILSEVLPEVKVYEDLYKKKIPIFVAGGIYSAQDIVKYQNKGASGVQIGTRFIATYECDASDAFKQKIIEAKKESVQLVKSPTGFPGRAIVTDFILKTQETRIPSTHCIACMKPCTPSTTPYCISEALIKSVQGDVENGLVFAGSNAYRVDKMMSVHDLIQELMNPTK
ncbi:MAG: nitronate monooxygenase family protein [Longicatena sp.]